MPNLGYFTSIGFTSPHVCYRGSRINWLQKFWGKNWKNKRFLLTLVQQLQPKEILHCSKLLQNITIKISCDISLYTWKIIWSREIEIACFDTSAILNLSLQGQQTCPILCISKWCSLPEKTGIHTVLQDLKNAPKFPNHEFDVQPKFYWLSSTHARLINASPVSCTFAVIISVALFGCASFTNW